MEPIVITGATSGLGLRAASILSSRGVPVVLGCRDVGRGEEIRATLHDPTNVRVVRLDVIDLDSVRRFAAEVPSARALVCNAGVQLVGPTRRTRGGIEETFAANHLGHFLLARLLWRSLHPGGCVVFVTSNTHDPRRMTGMPAPSVDDLDGLASGAAFADECAGTAGRRRYTTSKLCNVLCAYEFARRIRPRANQLRVIAFDPGLMPGTGLARDYGRAARWLWRGLGPLMTTALPNVNTVETSAQRLVALVSGDSEVPSGAYVSRGRVERSSTRSYDEVVARELWNLSSRLAEIPATLDGP